MHALLAAAGFEAIDAWYQEISYAFDAQQFFELRTRHGRSRARLALLDATTRAKVLDELQERLAREDRADYETRGRLVCAVGRRAA
jgi:hypothetical protein